MSKNKLEGKNVPCPKGHIAVEVPEKHYTMRQTIFCEQCRIMYAKILDHRCVWVRCNGKCASDETAWMCDKCAWSITGPSERDPNRDGYHPVGN